jgi:hypothetical protein
VPAGRPGRAKVEVGGGGPAYSYALTVAHGRGLFGVLSAKEVKYMRRFLLILAASVICFSVSTAGASFGQGGATGSIVALAADQSQLSLFSTEDAAQKHCPADIVVWLNTRSGIYHLKGERWYGRTKHGAYVCKKEADAAGDRETENGQ